MTYKRLAIRTCVILFGVGLGVIFGYFLSEMQSDSVDKYFVPDMKVYFSHIDENDPEQYYMHSYLQDTPIVSENIEEQNTPEGIVRIRHRGFVTHPHNNYTSFEDIYEMDVNATCVLNYSHKVYKFNGSKFTRFSEYLDTNGDGVFDESYTYDEKGNRLPINAK